MKYLQPFDQPSNPAAPFVDMNAAAGVDGSVPPAAFFNNVQAELLAVITGAGLTPDGAQLNQLYQAILTLIPTPSGAPSDASLVHYGVDSGLANAYILTPSPTCAGVGVGFTIFFLPLNPVTGPSSLTINLTPSGNVTKNLTRPDGTPLQNGDAAAGKLNAAVFDGTAFRLALPTTRVVSDGVTISGDGSPGAPLAAIGQGGPGTDVGQWICIMVGLTGSTAYHLSNPVGLTIGQVVTAAQIMSGTVPFSGDSTQYMQNESGYDLGGNNYGEATSYQSWFGSLTGDWKISGWFVNRPNWTCLQIFLTRIS